MKVETATLEEFLAHAATVLSETERDLQQLAQAALLQYQQSLLAQENGSDLGEDDERSLRLSQLSRQLAALSERSRFLQNHLQNGLGAPLPDESYWPQIKVLQSQEEERTQLARELENSAGQLLANAVFELASCRRLLASNQEAVTSGLDALQAELEQGLADIRHFIAGLEPAAILGNFGLGAGVRRYLEQFETRTGLQTRLRLNTNLGRLPSIIETAIFRVIREALSNVEQHARAGRVDVSIEEKDGVLVFSVIDNGQGLALEKLDASDKSLGLARMMDYAELLRGRLRILSEPGQGTQVILTIPYPTF